MFQAIARNTNRTSYVLGGITAQEAEVAISEDPSFTRHGLYLLLVDKENPRAPARVLAKFASEEAAMNVANFFRANGFLEDLEDRAS